MKFVHTYSSLSFLLGITAATLVGCSSGPEEGTKGDPGTGSGGLPDGGGSGATGSGGGTGSGGTGSGGAGAGGTNVGSDGGSTNSGGADSASGGSASGSGGMDSQGSQSAGCGMDAGQATGSWETSSVSVGGANRNYDVRLPASYDSATSYPVILLLHGCGSPTNNVPMDQEAGDEAIVVRGSGSNDGCWQETANGDDLPYIDAFMEDVQARFCVNPDHLFAVGYSSGSWLASTLSCHRGDVYRGIASVAGGEPSGQNGCSGQHGRIFIHDTQDMNNQLAWDMPSRDRMISTNNCSMNTMEVQPSPCVEYQDCDPGFPVVWCETTGEGHNRQDNLARPAFWSFFQRLMTE